MEQALLLAALIALLQMATERRRTAGDDGPPGARLRRAQRMLAQVGGPEDAQHLGQGGGHPEIFARGGSVSALRLRLRHHCRHRR